MNNPTSLESKQDIVTEKYSSGAASLPKADWRLRVVAYIYDALAAAVFGFIPYVVKI